MPLPPGFSGPPVTFGQIYDALNARQQPAGSGKPGQAQLPGDRFIAWVQQNGKAGPVGLTDFQYAGAFASQWFQSWLTFVVGHGIAKDLKAGFNVFGKIPGILGGTEAGIFSKTNGISGGGLNGSSILIRGGEIIAGAILLAIGLNAAFKKPPLTVVTKAAGALAKAVP